MSERLLPQQFNAQLLQLQQKQQPHITRRDRINVSLSSSAALDMDILDIDEALKDDSFIVLEDKMHDDVCNILRQWKSNNCIPTLQHIKDSQQEQEHQQVYKLNSRTFTRPRRAGKSILNLENQYANIPHTSLRQNGVQNQMLNVEIGGIVTSMHKSFLQDTSPPSSICSSLDVSMTNSLITSADFSTSFLKSTNNSLYDNSVNNLTLVGPAAVAHADSYTLNDMVRDRKALESLTMSGDGAFIKDSHIGQIDEISLALSKTASGCSTMDNSTDSVGDGRTFNAHMQEETVDDQHQDANRTTNIQHALNYTFEVNDISDMKLTANNNTVLFDNKEMMISDMSLNLMDNSLYAEDANKTKLLHNITHNVSVTSNDILSQTYKKLSEDAIIGNNLTFDASDRCNTPENSTSDRQFCVSTPYTADMQLNNDHANANNNNNIINNNMPPEDVDISPITTKSSKLHSKHHDTAETMALEQELELELIEEAYSTLRKNKNGAHQRRSQYYDIDLPHVLAAVQAEAELLEGKDEEQFEHMLDEFSRVELTEDQQKMKKSYELIKKRFNYCHVGSAAADKNSKLRNELLLKKSLEPQSDSDLCLTSSTDAMCNSGSNTSISGSRLLSRRSRLYDDVNLSALSSTSANSSTAFGTSFIVQKPSAAKLEIKSDSPVDVKSAKEEQKTDNAADAIAEAEAIAAAANDATEVSLSTSPTSYKLTNKRNRDRDRFKTIKLNKPSHGNVIDVDIENVPLIDKDHNENTHAMMDKRQPQSQPQPQQQQQQKNEQMPLLPPRLSRRDYTATTAITTNTGTFLKSTLSSANQRTDADTIANSDKMPATHERAQSIPSRAILNTNNNNATNTKNYLTYKKVKDSKLNYGSASLASNNVTAVDNTNTKTKFGYRPLGLKPLSIYDKAISAGDLQKTLSSNATTSSNRTAASTQTKQLPQSDKMSSQLGMKSKSFHNLASGIGFQPATTYSSGNTADATAQRSNRKPYSGSASIEKTGSIGYKPKSSSATSLQQTFSQKTDEIVFKMPKLTSGLRAPAAAANGVGAGKRAAGLVRPSSGYYSLNAMGKAATLAGNNEADLEATGRHSPTNSMSSTSSCSSSSIGGNVGGIGTTALKAPKMAAPNEMQSNCAKTKQVQVAAAAAVSGAKHASNLKRSGLPRPKSFVKH